jgi:hypothetical protein
VATVERCRLDSVCGLTKSVNGVTLRFGKSKGCYSCSKQDGPFARRYAPGEKVEKWTIVRFLVKSSAYLCMCECGRTATHGVATLKRGKPSCCGACSEDTRKQRRATPQIDLTGQCDCGTRGLRQATNLATGYRLAKENTGCRNCSHIRAGERSRRNGTPRETA